MPKLNLLTPGHIGDFDTPNRMVMAPMTRSRCEAAEVPSEIAVEYYTQRASAGLIITEGTAPVATGIGYARTPSIYSPEQIAAWRKITDAVHAAGGHMFLQLMHVGRIGHAANRISTEPLVAPSAIRAAGQMWTDTLGLQDNDMPRALDTDEIPGVIEGYAQATRNALMAGFDGVELHSASGYLPMQFLSTGSNHRTDAYGGTLENRLRFVIETLEAMIAAAGSPSRVGIKISPAMPFNDIQDDNPAETYTALVKAISPLQLAYLHVMQSAPLSNAFELLRPLFRGMFLAGAGFSYELGNRALSVGLADFIVFGRLFVANPDLPQRFFKGAELTTPDPATFYSPGPKGYIDYPVLEATD